jgi:hypothetical protein
MKLKAVEFSGQTRLSAGKGFLVSFCPRLSFEATSDVAVHVPVEHNGQV